MVGADARNMRSLQRLSSAEHFRYHEVSTGGMSFAFNDVLDRALRQLESFDGPVDAIIGCWDFPVMPIVCILADRFGTLAPSLESDVKCEHKFWSRVVQREATDAVPAFAPFDPFAEDALAAVRHLGFPLWVKPVVGTDSELGFKVGSEKEFDAARDAIRREIPPMARGFDELLDRVALPPAIAEVSGRFCLAEALIRGEQCTVSGYVHRGEVTTYGIVDSHNFPGTSSFQRYEYPSELPRSVQERLEATARRVMEHIGFDNGTFNIEFFHDAERDAITLLEVNPRMSQSHGDLYEKVDGQSNHRLMVRLALGERPAWRRGRGRYRKAAKCFIRCYDEDALVHRVPTKGALAAIVRDEPDTIIDIPVVEGKRLSDVRRGEPHSCELANVFIGGADSEELREKAERIAARLDFELEPLHPVETR